ncbi:methyltransferase [Nocardia sp. NPDC049707]|uniref:methyltransferase n=1 Tax=Nocardia sp. NPDC049707 TaxID=3154735 RepID=UPI003415F02D
MTAESTEMLPGPTTVMTQMLAGFQVSQALYVIAKLDVATVLDDGPLSHVELARRTGAHPPSLRRLIRTLAPLGVFRTEGELVHTTELGAVLSRRHPQSLHAVAHFWMETHYRPFAELLRTARTGETAATYHLGEPFFNWIAADPDRAALLSRAMAEVTGALRTGMFDGYQLPEGEVVADIGGADGSVLHTLLAGESGRRGIVFDQPTVVPTAEKRIRETGVADRVVALGGDFFAEVPRADVYILSYVLHDWDDASALRILGSIAAAAKPGARLLILEGIVPEGDVAHMTKMIDLTMLGITSGRERTAVEYESLLNAGGFTVDRTVPTPSPYSIIEATLSR